MLTGSRSPSARRPRGRRAGGAVVAACAALPLALLLVILPAAHAVEDPSSSGQVLWVSTEGQDFAADGYTIPVNTRDTPWRTITMAIRRAQPGDTIMVRGGTYEENAGWRGPEAPAARADARITLMPASGETVVLKGSLQMDNASYWTVRGLRITDSPALSGRVAFLVKFNGGEGWEFVGNEVYGARRVANVMVTATLGAPRDFRIVGNCIHDVRPGSPTRGNDHNLYLMTGPGSRSGLVAGNVIFGAPNGSNIKAAGNGPATSPSNLDIVANTLGLAPVGVAVGLDSRSIRMDRNAIGLYTSLRTSHGFDAGVKGYAFRGRDVSVSNSLISSYPYPVRVDAAGGGEIATSGIVTADPGWTGITCAGFQPASPLDARYGHRAYQG